VSFFRWLVATRLRALLTSVVLVAIAVGATGPMTEFLRYRSTSVALNMLLLTVFAFLMLGAATYLAIVIGDRLFPGRWRERVILGRRIEPEADDDSLAALSESRTFYLHFSVIIVVLLVAGLWTFDRVTDFSLRETHQHTVLRSDNVNAKLELLRDLSAERRDDRVTEAFDVLDLVWRDESQPTEVRQAAFSAIAALGRYLGAATDRWRLEGRLRSPQEALLIALAQTLAPDLRRFLNDPSLSPDERASLSDPPEELRAHAVYAVGSLRDRRARHIFERELDAYPDDGSDGWQSAVIAIGRARAHDLLPRIIELLRHERDHEAFVRITWTVVELLKAFHRAYPTVDERRLPAEVRAALSELVTVYGDIVKSGAPERRCLAAVVLAFTRDIRIREIVFEAFDAPGAAELTCDQESVQVLGSAVDTLGDAYDSLRQRLIDAVALVSQGDLVVTRWAQSRLSRDTDDDEYVEILLTDLLEKLGQRVPRSRSP